MDDARIRDTRHKGYQHPVVAAIIPEVSVRQKIPAEPRLAHPAGRNRPPERP
jgi:hypothetical protein